MEAEKSKENQKSSEEQQSDLQSGAVLKGNLRQNSVDDPIAWEGGEEGDPGNTGGSGNPGHNSNSGNIAIG